MGAQDAMEEVLSSFSRLRQLGRHFVFDVYGGCARDLGRIEELICLSERLGIADCVQFHGQQPHQKVKEAIYAADILVGIRRTNQWALSGLSTKLSEYLASGRPTIASSIGDGGGYLKSGENCLLVQDPNRQGDFDLALRQALEAPPETLKRLGENGRALSKRQFGIEVHVPTIRKIFGLHESDLS